MNVIFRLRINFESRCDPPSILTTPFRQLHHEINQAVAHAYGWDDLELEHGFHETKQGLRYTISEAARREVLDRLLLLNHERHEEHHMTQYEDLVQLRQKHIGRYFWRAHRAFVALSGRKLAARGYTGLGMTHTTLIAHLDTQGTCI